MEIQEIKQELRRISETYCFLGDDNDDPCTGVQVGRVLPRNADKLAKEVVALDFKINNLRKLSDGSIVENCNEDQK